MSDKESGKRPKTSVGFSSGTLSGFGDLVEFLFPLWAGAVLGISPTVIGTVLAVELAVAVLLRPAAGRCADVVNRAVLSAGGAGAFAAGLGVLAVAQAVPTVFVAAVLLGAGSAFFWVPLRALVGEDEDPKKAFTRLTEVEGHGIWIVYVVVLSLIPTIAYAGAFVLGAVAVAVAALHCLFVLRRAPAANPRWATVAKPVNTGAGTVLHRQQAARWTVFVVLVALVEAAAAIYLLLRLQQEFNLVLMEVVWCYVPGLIAYSLIPRAGIELERLLGERLVVLLAVSLSASGVLLVTLGGQVLVLAGGWVLMSLSWGLLDPVQQTTALRVNPGGLGRSMGRYESATLAGAAGGSFLGGAALEFGAPAVVSVAAVVACLLNLAVIPKLYQPRKALSPRAGVATETGSGTEARATTDSSELPPTINDPTSEPARPAKRGKKPAPGVALHNAFWHVVVYLAAQIPLAWINQSWYRDMFEAGRPLFGREMHDNLLANAVYTGNMIWGLVALIEVLWAAAVFIRAALAQRKDGEKL